MRQREKASNTELMSDNARLLVKVKELEEALDRKQRSGQYGSARQGFLRSNQNTLDIWKSDPKSVWKLKPVSKCMLVCMSNYNKIMIICYAYMTDHNSTTLTYYVYT